MTASTVEQGYGEGGSREQLNAEINAPRPAGSRARVAAGGREVRPTATLAHLQRLVRNWQEAMLLLLLLLILSRCSPSQQVDRPLALQATTISISLPLSLSVSLSCSLSACKSDAFENHIMLMSCNFVRACVCVCVCVCTGELPAQHTLSCCLCPSSHPAPASAPASAPAVCNYAHKAGQVLELPKLFDQRALHPLSAGVLDSETGQRRGKEMKAGHDFTFFIGKLFADSNANLSINSERLFMIANHSHVSRLECIP